MTKSREAIILLRKTNPLTKEVLEKGFDLGVIRKKDLKDGAYYLGSCRNASIATWNKNENKFVYIRSKFGTQFIETIEHPEDDTGYDIFIPIKEIEVNIDG